MDSKLLKQHLLFQGMTDNEFATALEQLAYRQTFYYKGSYLLQAGQQNVPMGLVLSGSVTIESNDLWGNHTILGIVEAGQFFGETYALLPQVPMLVDVVANTDCDIIFFHLNGIWHASSSEWKTKLLRNLLFISAQKNMGLSQRSFHTSPKSIRGRVMSYLNTEALKKGGPEFDIPFDRQQLADYLNLERTALSKELGRMQREGLITCRKRHFVIHHSVASH